MGRKGVSKRKPRQNKSKPVSSDKDSGSASSVIQAVKSQPVKTLDTGKSAPSPKKGKKSSSGGKKNSKKR